MQPRRAEPAAPLALMYVSRWSSAEKARSSPPSMRSRSNSATRKWTKSELLKSNLRMTNADPRGAHRDL